MKEFWNDRYQEEPFAYGKEPNKFYEEVLKNLDPGKILLPAEGEGRNAVFASKLGWKVDCFDQSIEGIKKANQLCEELGVSINYFEGNLSAINELGLEPESYDSIALIYVHTPPPIRKKKHRELAKLLKKGGIMIIEAFNKNQIGNPSGGPQKEEMLFDKETLLNDFDGILRTKLIEEVHVELNEGLFHIGKADVVRFIGEKM